MNKDTIRGDWNMMKGKIKEKWGKLTDDDLTEINGKKEQLLGKIQKKYGIAKDKAEHEIAEWENKISPEGHYGRESQAGSPGASHFGGHLEADRGSNKHSKKQ